MAIPGFFYHHRSMSYDFGPRHPLKPVRLARTMALLEAAAPDVEFLDPGLASREDIARCHEDHYIDFVRALSEGHEADAGEAFSYGFTGGDTPPFTGMYEAACAYTGGGVKAAQMVNEGAALAFNMSGGLHHAQAANASGFCVFNDVAISTAILRERFDRVAYVDIDLHHGDGVQALFYDDPTVLTYSIHQNGRTLYPGTGFLHETGADLSSVNVPLWPGTTGPVWIRAFKETISLAFDRFQPQAVVLQMGTDAHRLDPLGHLECLAQHWLEAVAWVRDYGVPIVAAGGGGYNLTTVPRMWTAAVLTLCGREVPVEIPASIPREWGMSTFLDPEVDEPLQGEEEAEKAIGFWRRTLG